jgi:hypothetical protein
MLTIFDTKSPAQLKKNAKQEFDKVSALEGDSRNIRSLRVRMSLLCRAHLDKTFIDGAERMAAYQDILMACLAAGESLPPEPEGTLFQLIETSGGKSVWVYLPADYVDQVFNMGMRYQRMDITAQVAIDSVQNLLDQICRFEFKLDDPLVALQFLRDELAQEAGEAGDDDGLADGNSEASPA